MRTLPYAQVDAFAERPFTGNPAAVVRMGDRPLAVATMQEIAAEANLSETAFVEEGSEPGHYGLRWFTPTLEVDLCGHATLAAGHVVLLDESREEVSFHTRSGLLRVRRTPDGLAMELPRIPWWETPHEASVTEVLGARPAALYAVQETHGALYRLAVFEREEQVRALRPDTVRMGRELGMNIIATAPADAPEVDVASRFFAPASGVPEDPVTGSAHCTLGPFWAARLGRSRLVAQQVSARGGRVVCEVGPDRVTLVGRCVDYLRGRIRVPDGPVLGR